MNICIAIIYFIFILKVQIKSSVWNHLFIQNNFLPRNLSSPFFRSLLLQHASLDSNHGFIFAIVTSWRYNAVLVRCALFVDRHYKSAATHGGPQVNRHDGPWRPPTDKAILIWTDRLRIKGFINVSMGSSQLARLLSAARAWTNRMDLWEIHRIRGPPS